MKPCETCPFAGMEEREKMLAVEGDECAEMLCHESWCLDGSLPDRPCVGFHGTAGKSIKSNDLPASQGWPYK